MSRDEIVAVVMKELDRAKTKFPSWPTDPIHAAAIVQEEAGELVRAVLQWTYECDRRTEAEDEAIQTAAMAIRFLLHFRDYRTRESEQVVTP